VVGMFLYLLCLQLQPFTILRWDDCYYNVGLNVGGAFNNHRSLFIRILAHTRLYRTERTIELTLPSQFITFLFVQLSCVSVFCRMLTTLTLDIISEFLKCVGPSIRLSICVSMSVCLYLRMSVYLSVICMSACPPVCQFLTKSTRWVF